MKVKTAMNICNGFQHVYRAGYCDLQFIAPNTMIEPQFYNCGVYGWNCDLYADYETDTLITTGYRNTRGDLIPRELLHKYNALAGQIHNKKFSDYNEMRAAYYENFRAFIKELNARQ